MKTTKTDLDQIAVTLLLKGDARRLEMLAARVRAYHEGRVECPECGSEGPHDHNGDRRDPSWSCAACGLCFDDVGA